jgi:hypothetical protein
MGKKAQEDPILLDKPITADKTQQSHPPVVVVANKGWSEVQPGVFEKTYPNGTKAKQEGINVVFTGSHGNILGGIVAKAGEDPQTLADTWVAKNP